MDSTIWLWKETKLGCIPIVHRKRLSFYVQWSWKMFGNRLLVCYIFLFTTFFSFVSINHLNFKTVLEGILKRKLGKVTILDNLISDATTDGRDWIAVNLCLLCQHIYMTPLTQVWTIHSGSKLLEHKLFLLVKLWLLETLCISLE